MCPQGNTFQNVLFSPSSQDDDKAASSSFDNEGSPSGQNDHPKKDHQKQPVQPTATQIMLSQLIGGEQKNMDEVQRNKIQQASSHFSNYNYLPCSGSFKAIFSKLKQIVTKTLEFFSNFSLLKKGDIN